MIYKECYESDELLIEIYTPDDPCQVIYFFGPSEELDLPYDLLDTTKTACISIYGEDWYRDLTPWTAPGLRKNDPAFGGGADEFLKRLFFDLIPQAEDAVECMVDVEPDWTKHRYICGISLSGLFALYSLYRTDLFTRAAGISASLWYDEMVDFIKNHKIYQGVEQIALFLGEKEKQTRNPRMAVVENCTREVCLWLQQKGVRTTLELVPGGHFSDGKTRIRQAFEKLLTVPVELE